MGMYDHSQMSVINTWNLPRWRFSDFGFNNGLDNVSQHGVRVPLGVRGGPAGRT